MRPFLFLAAFIFIFSSSLFAQTESTKASAAQKKLVVLGDSLTEGYGVAKDSAFPAVLEKLLHEAGKKEWTVINAGVSGSTTASALSRMKWLFKTKPQVVFLALGANDGLRGIKTTASEKNLADAIEYAQKENVKIILGGLYMPPNYGAQYTRDFKKIYQDLAKKYKLSFVPFILDKVAGDPKYNLADGIHPNEAGHKIIAETVFKSVKGAL
jgi:acyl-CoA thioesterase-1